MNAPDSDDTALRAAIRARLAAAPEPSAGMTARTLARVDGERPRAEQRTPAARWWSALAAPSHFALAAAIVFVVGTLTFGTLKVTHRWSAGGDTAPSATLTLDRRMPARLARTAWMELSVRDVAASVRRITTLTERAQGQVKAAASSSRVGRRFADLTLRVPANRLEATMQAIALLGSVDRSGTSSRDLSAALLDTNRRLARAQGAARAPLAAQRERLIGRIARATLELTLREMPSGRELSAADELRVVAVRRTGIPLARGQSREQQDALFVRPRLRAVGGLAFTLATTNTSPGA